MAILDAARYVQFPGLMGVHHTIAIQYMNWIRPQCYLSGGHHPGVTNSLYNMCNMCQEDIEHIIGVTNSLYDICREASTGVTNNFSKLRQEDITGDTISLKIGHKLILKTFTPAGPLAQQRKCLNVKYGGPSSLMIGE